MGHAKYIGRVGALAVALGVGMAVTGNPGVAWASPDADTTAEDTTTNISDTATAPASPADTGQPDTATSVTTSETATPATPAVTQSPSQTTLTSPVAPDVVIRSSGGALTSNEYDTSPTIEPLSQSVSIDTRPAVAPSAAKGSAPERLPSAPSALTTPITRTELPTVRQQEAPAARMSTMRIAALDVSTPTPQPTTTAVTTFSAPAVSVAPAPVDPIAALFAIPAALIQTALSLTVAVLNAVLVPAPGAPPDSPLLWAVLAAVRRQLFNVTPTAVNDAVTTSEDTPTLVDVLANDVDADGDPLTTTVLSAPAHGQLVSNPNGSFSYSPDAEFSGTDTFTYTVSDESGGTHLHGLTGLLNLFGISESGHTATATATITVGAVDDAPTAVGDNAMVVEDSAATLIAVLGNDTDVDGGPRTITSVTQPAHGTVAFTGTTLTYKPAADFAGVDSFGYTLNGGSAATVSVTVTAVDDAPVAGNDTATVAEDSVAVLIPVLGNDTDIDGGPKTITSVTQPAHGTVAFTGTTLTYKPAADYNGPDSFGYTLAGGSAATVAVTVTAVDDAPVAVSDVATVAEDSVAVLIPVLANDTDIDAGPKIITATTQPVHGTVTFTDTTLTYTPTANYNGPDTFGYTLVGGSTAIVTVTVAAADDAPDAADDVATVAEDSVAVLIPVLANDTDIDGGPKTITFVTQPANGTVTNTATTLTYTPTANYNGPDTFTYTLAGGSAATVTVTVTPVDDAPVAVSDVATVAEDSTNVLIPVLANDTDIDAGPKTITAVTQPAHGIITFTATTVRYTPIANYNGPDTFGYTLAGGTTATATVTVTVTPVNDAPVLTAATSTPGVGNTWVVTVSASDVDGDALTTTVTSTNSTPLTVTQLPGGAVQVVVDPTWASAHPGAQLPVTVTVTDAQNVRATRNLIIGTVSNVTAIGYNVFGQTNIPALPAGVTYTQVAVSTFNTVLLRSDGTAVAIGYNSDGQNNIPQLPAGITYTYAVVGGDHTVLLRSDGTAISFGDNYYGQSNIPQLPTGVTYIRIAAGNYNTVLLRSDGTVVAVGDNEYGQTNVPQLPTGVTYTDVAVGDYHTVLLRSDGTVVAFGGNGFGQNNIPALPTGVKYTAIATGDIHTLLLRSDGIAVAVGNTQWGQTAVPTLPAGMTYTQVAAGHYNSALLRSDGTVIGFGQNFDGQLNIPALSAGVTYTRFAVANHTVLITSTTATPVNAPPVATNDSVTVAEGGTITVSVTANDTDADGTIDTATVVITRNPTAGSVTVNAGGTVTYVSSGSEATADSYAYRVNDNTGATSNQATVSITITAVNDAPVAVNDSYSTNANTALTVPVRGVLSNDLDSDSVSLAATLVTGPAHGLLNLNPNGSFSYTPAANYSGTDSFTYRVTDGSLTSNTATVSLTINVVDDRPVANSDSYAVTEDSPLTVTGTGVLGNDSDPGNSPLTAVKVSDPAHGTVTLNANGSFTYAPAANYYGPDSFTYKVNNGVRDSAVATVTLTVSAVNDAPVANPDTYSVAEDTPLTVAAALGLLGNDTDVDGPAIRIVGVTAPAHAAAFQLLSDGSFTYTPAPNYSGTDSFTYRISDGIAPTASATVTITITPVNDAPTAANDSYSTTANVAVTVAAPGVLVNDVDPEGNPISAVLATGPSHGTLTLNPNGSFSYTPVANYVGSDSFTYRASDGAASSTVATVNLTVKAANKTPTGNPDTYTVTEDATLTVNAPGVLSNDTDADGDVLVVSAGTPTAHGSFELRSDGSFTYTPAPNYHGTDTFTYQASDGIAVTAPTTVTINVTSVNDVPVVVNSTIPLAKNGFYAITLATESSDADGDKLTATLLSGTQNGVLFFDGVQRAFTYKPNTGFTGQDSFTYKVNDGTVDSLVATVTLVIS